ncbi:MAG: YihY/virulence factor BrkB family protein [Candidatus Bathyarchaeia archaeon]|jgi:membrane protein
MDRKQFASLLKESFSEWQVNSVSLRSAALAFFIILPLPSLLLILMVVSSQFLGQTQAFQQLIAQISAVAGPAVANLITQVLQSSKTPSTSFLATVTFVGFSVAGVIGAFQVLRNTMDIVWKISPPPKRRTLMTRIRRNIRPFLLVFSVVIIIIAWTVIMTAILSSVGSVIVPMTGGLNSLFLRILQIVLSFILATGLFAIIYREVPDTDIQWGDVKIAAVMVAVVFSITNVLFSWYIQTFSITSVAGAAGAIMILLSWVFIMNQLMLFGAEFSKTYAIRFGSQKK